MKVITQNFGGPKGDKSQQTNKPNPKEQKTNLPIFQTDLKDGRQEKISDFPEVDWRFHSSETSYGQPNLETKVPKKSSVALLTDALQKWPWENR